MKAVQRLAAQGEILRAFRVLQAGQCGARGGGGQGKRERGAREMDCVGGQKGRGEWKREGERVERERVEEAVVAVVRRWGRGKG